MTGSDIIGALLLADADVTEMFPEGQIKAGRLPDGVELPVLLVKVTSEIEPRQALVRGATTRSVERVSVTVRASSHRDRKRAMGLVKKCCAGRTGDLGGAVRVSILTAGTGPELDGPSDSFEQTKDFRVSHDA